MTGYIIESLNATGWRRSNVIQFRFTDAERQAQGAMTDGLVRAVRILPVTVGSQPVFAQERNDPVAHEEEPIL